MSETNLADLTTFGVKSTTTHLHKVSALSDLMSCAYHPDNWFILGGGSNVLFIENAPEHVLLVENQGIDYVDMESEVHVVVQAGVNWHDLVIDTLVKGFSGLENLALIPGKVGAAPIQNIGAYGVELSERFVSLKAWDFKRQELIEFSLEDCQFGYRDSYFKSSEGNQMCIWEVTLRLDKTFEPVLSYHGLTQFEENEGLTPQMVFDKVVSIRQSKLPDPAVIGNAGSFFKNPVIDIATYGKLVQQYPTIVAYPQKGAKWKLAAAWLIDQAGLKGYRAGDAGIHDKQALVLVNHGGASGSELVSLAKHVQHTVYEKFGVMLEPEVNIVSASGRMTLDDV